jgi:sec-independent protein translocase protein TatA
MPFPNIGPGELILILIIALVVLGPGKLPDVAASLGKSVREFRRAATDVSDAGKLDAPAAKTPTAAPAVPAPPAVPPAPADAPSAPASDAAPGPGSAPARDSNPS